VGLTDPTDADDVFDLSGFQFGILFDPLLLGVGVPSEGPFLSSDGGATAFAPGFPDPAAPGILPFISAARVDATGVSGAGILVSLQFLALASGVAPISIVLDSAIGDGLYDPVGILAGVAMEGVTTTEPFSVTISASPTGVPEPGTLLLLGLGAGLAAAGRHRISRS
jgi:hypothetical protein